MSNPLSKCRVPEMFMFDIFIAIHKIKNTITDYTDAQKLLYSYRDWDSVIREFEIIGEASKRLLVNGDFQIIVDFRNRITHGYFGIDENLVWSIAENDLTDFLQIIQSLISKIEPHLKQELIVSFKEDNKYLDFIVNVLEQDL